MRKELSPKPGGGRRAVTPLCTLTSEPAWPADGRYPGPGSIMRDYPLQINEKVVYTAYAQRASLRKSTVFGKRQEKRTLLPAIWSIFIRTQVSRAVWHVGFVSVVCPLATDQKSESLCDVTVFS
jgi:hypothetical protein